MDQVFDHAVTPLQSLGKPIWILSEGVVSSDNQSAFISATFAGTKTYNLGGFIYFNYTGGGNFELGSSALSPRNRSFSRGGRRIGAWIRYLKFCCSRSPDQKRRSFLKPWLITTSIRFKNTPSKKAK